MPTRWITRYPRHILLSLYSHRIFLGLLLLYALVVRFVGMLPYVAQPIHLKLYGYHTRIAFAMMAVALLAHRVWYLGRVEKEPRPIGRLVADGKRWLQSGDQLVSLALVLLVLPWFHSAFTCFKTMIPRIHAFDWDQYLAQTDRWLHGGVMPHEITRLFIATPTANFVVNLLYHLWYPVMGAFIFWQAFQNRHPLLRMRFFIGYLLIWSVIGSCMALSLSSAGPCFFGALVEGSNPYAEHMEWLQSIDQRLTSWDERTGVWALHVQQMLWEMYSGERLEVGSGISAMPSMHVAMASLMALTAWSYGGWRRWGFVAFALIIQVGSVHLGWHYAMDGYVALAATVIVWRASAVLARWSLHHESVSVSRNSLFEMAHGARRPYIITQHRIAHVAAG